MEVMRYQDLYEPITAAEDDPTSAVLMDPLPDQPNILGISVLRPYTRTVSHQWLLNYRQQSITPQGLVSRDWTSFPASEVKKPGPVFGTNVGRGVCVGAVPAPPPPPLALPRCPNMLEIRQVLQYLPSSKLRDRYGIWILCLNLITVIVQTAAVAFKRNFSLLMIMQ
jgi:hypothetical protein